MCAKSLVLDVSVKNASSSFKLLFTDKMMDNITIHKQEHATCNRQIFRSSTKWLNEI